MYHHCYHQARVHHNYIAIAITVVSSITRCITIVFAEPGVITIVITEPGFIATCITIVVTEPDVITTCITIVITRRFTELGFVIIVQLTAAPPSQPDELLFTHVSLCNIRIRIHVGSSERLTSVLRLYVRDVVCHACINIASRQS